MDFKSVLGKSPNPYVLLDRDLVIIWANEAYLAATMRDLADIVGHGIFEAFPSEGESYRQLSTSFERVVETGEPDEIAHIRYDIPDPGGSYRTHYWSATHTPFLDEQGAVSHILQHTVDITEVEELRRMRDATGVLQRAREVEQRYAGASEELARLRSLFEQAPGFVAVLSGEDHRFVMANAAYRRLVGQRDLIGRTVAEALPEVVDQGFLDILDRVIATGNPYFGEREFIRLLNSEEEEDLREMHLEFIFQLIFNSDGVAEGIIIQGHDVTEEVAADEHQRLLINELNHRVKNTLAVVQGIAQQSFRGFAGDPSFGAFNSRIATLANAHNLLTEKRWESAELGSVVRRSLAATLGDGQTRVSIAGPRVKLAPQAAVALSMVIHELTTNAIKYGALSVQDGEIAVNWEASPDGDDTHVVLTWEERGGPRVEEPDRRGFGTRLIRRGFGTGSGQAELSFSEDGLTCRMEASL